MTTINSESPCTATMTPDDNGGLTVALFVPTYGGGATFEMSVERDRDGDWTVFIPWPADIEEATIQGMEVLNGILYLGSPDVEVAISGQA